MPEIKLQHIVSVSSEDKNFPADNLLKSDAFKKWSCASAGEKQLTVTLQFAKASQINQIDVGNAGSAFVEILVGKSSSKDEDFQVILVASSFLNPTESRAEQNLNRVRIFSADKLSKAVQDQKWDRVKIICTQPFNKSLCYGLSFIKFHTEPSKSPPKVEKQLTLGAFTLKEEEEDEIKTGSLFANRRKSHDAEEDSKLSAAAQVREASRTAAASEKMKSPLNVEKHAAKRKLSKEENCEEKNNSAAVESSPKAPLRKQSTSLSSLASVGSSKSKRDAPPLKRTKTEPGKYSKEKQFSQLMEDVVFVMSGYQNPERGKIRDKALEMGAQYKPDWVKGCTHLICAFANTPKYNAVKGKGRIVSKDWVKDCYKQKKLLPWRMYRMGKAPSPPNSSGSDTEEDYTPVKKTQKKATPEAKESRSSESKLPEESEKAPSKAEENDDDDDLYGGSTDCESGGDTDENDTDDEIQKIRESEQKAKNSTTPKTDQSKENIPMDVSENSDGELPPLPSFFSKKCFFLYGKVDPALRRSLFRFIIAYDGTLEDYMGDKITHVITNEGWDENFDDALSNNADLIFVKPSWILACDEKQKLVPYQKYAVAPN